MNITSLTDIGKKRSDNQDNYWCSRLEIDGEEVGVVCICDGMGGLEHGARASRLVVEKVRNCIHNGIEISYIKDAIYEANNEILGFTGTLKKSGTTCTLLICYKGVYRILHIGDTRCYKLSGGNEELLTIDHSALAEYQRRGIEVKENDIKRYKNSLIRCIGVKENVQLDYIEGSYVEGDIFVVCSDGVWHYFEENGVSGINNLRELVDNCMSSGETDNITIGVLKV